MLEEKGVGNRVKRAACYISPPFRASYGVSAFARQVQRYRSPDQK